MTPQQHSAAIAAHYIRQLAQRAGLVWTPQNEQDMREMVALASDGELANSIPPYRKPITTPTTPLSPPDPLKQAAEHVRGRQNGRER